MPGLPPIPGIPVSPNPVFPPGVNPGHGVAQGVQGVQGAISTFDVLWGWVSNPVRIFKLTIGAVIIIVALFIVFRESPQVKQVISSAQDAAKIGAVAA